MFEITEFDMVYSLAKCGHQVNVSIILRDVQKLPWRQK